MSDVWLLGLLVGFFLLTAGLVQLAEKLRSKEEPR